MQRICGGSPRRRARITIRGVGTFELALFTAQAPATVLRFARLAESGYYNGLTFHRVVPNFVIQGGSPGANEYIGDAAFMRDEVGAWPHVRGAVGISTRGRDTGDAQIFIDLVDNPRLDHDYTVFAQVLNGIDVVDGFSKATSSTASRSIPSAAECGRMFFRIAVAEHELATESALDGDGCAAARAQGRPVLDLTVTNPTRAGFDVSSRPARAAGRSAKRSATTLEPFGRLDAREAVARDYERQGVRVDADRIVLTASTSEAYSLLFKLLADAGDEVLVPRPSYPLFEHLTRLDLVTAIPYHLEYHGAWSIDLASVERAISRAHARAAARVAEQPDRVVRRPRGARSNRGAVSDARHRHHRRRGVRRLRAGARRPGGSRQSGDARRRPDVLARWTVEVGRAAAGQARMDRGGWSRCARCSGDRPARARSATPICRCRRRCRSRRLACWRRERASARRLRHARPQTINTFSKPSPRRAPAGVLRSDAGWNAVLQVPTLQSEEDLVLHLLENDGVLAQPGYFFDFPRESFVVVSLITPPAVLADGIGRLLRHFDCSVVNP